MTTHDVVRGVLAGARVDPGAPAIRAGRRSLRHGELHRRVDVLTARLRAEGLRPGDRMLFTVRPGPDAVVLALALLRAGGVLVVADPGAGPAVFAARVALTRPSWAAAESLLYALRGSAPLRPLAARRGLLLPDYGALGVRLIRSGPWLPGVPRGAGSLTSWSTRPSPPAVEEGEDPGEGSTDPALVVFTSGTTGAPRAVVHSRRSLGTALATATTALALQPGDTVLTDQLMIGLTALAAGACWDVPPIGAAPAVLARRLRESGPSHVFTTPVTWDGMLTEGGADGWPDSLRHLLTGGAPVPAGLLARLAAAAPHARVTALYGGTELLPAATVDAPEKVAYDGAGDLVGRLLPGVGARIDPGSGEVHLTAGHLCEGYLGAQGVLPMGEFATGDAGFVVPAPDGDRLVLTGRLKEMIIRGSTNIYPGLYEPEVRKLAGVRECALVGLPDPRTGDERVVLAVVAAPGTSAAQVLQRVRAALPRAFDAAATPDDVLLVEALPRSGRSGKLDRTRLADLVRSRLQTGAGP